MTRFKVNGFGLFILMVSLIGLLLLSACGKSGSGDSGGNAGGTTENQSDPYALYNMVQMGMTKEQVDAALGVTPEELIADGYTYKDKDGYGVVVVYSDLLSQSGAKEVISKMVEGITTPEYLSTVIKKVSITDEQTAKITEGMTFDEVKTILGSDGMEYSVSDNFDGTVNVTRMWLKNGLSPLTLIFKGADGSGTVVQIVAV